MKISVTVTLKKDVLDPQGKVVNQTLKNMGYEIDKNKAKTIIEEICKKLLTNTVIEDYKINYK